jgi:glycosyltransferase involved in cell wall biosynthesis
VLLRALAAAKLDWPLKVIGGGPARPELEKLACDLGIEKRVDFVGPLYGDDLNRAITNSGAVVLPSRWFENMPYAMLEALALGKPVLGARSGGIPEIVREGENGYLFEPNNSLELSSVLDKLEEADLAAMGASARASVKRLDPEDHYLAISELFEKLTVK